MSRIGVQQLSPQMLEAIKNDIQRDIQANLPSSPSVGGAIISVGTTPPIVSQQGSVWMETGMGAYEPGDTIMLSNVLIMKDEIPENYNPKKDILFDID